MQITDWVNLTPHDIVIKTRTIKASGIVCRIEETETIQRSVDEITVVFKSFGNIKGLPQYRGKLTDNYGIVGSPKFIVSLPVLMALKAQGSKRTDIFAPDTGKSCIRENGQIKAVVQLIALNPNVIKCELCQAPTPFKQISDGICISCQEGLAECEQ